MLICMCYINMPFIYLYSMIHSETCLQLKIRSRRDRDRMVVGFITTCAISAYHHSSCKFEPRSWRGVLDTTLCDKVRQ